MIVVLGGIKGGSGKTTLATNLAAMRSATHRVLLVDADEQQSAWDWSRQRECSVGPPLGGTLSTIWVSGKAVYSNLLRWCMEYDDIIVDTGGRDTTSQRAALCVADKLVIPFKPSSIDIWTLVPIKTILDECLNPNLKCCSVINQADSSGKDNQEAIDILKELPSIQAFDCTIGNRKAFRNAAAEGLGVTEIPLRDKKACLEMECLYRFIYN